MADHRPDHLCAAVAALALVAAPVAAQSLETIGWQAHDLDGDGALDAEEWEGAGLVVFEELNRNADDQLAPIELMALFDRIDEDGDGRIGTETAQGAVARLDADGDGEVELHEWAEAIGDSATIDADGDGALAREEFLALWRDAYARWRDPRTGEIALR